MSLSLCLACACSEATDPFQSWIGRDSTALTQVWGQPTNETEQTAGRALTYVSYWQDGYGIHQCQRTFAVDARGVITGHASSDC